MKSEIINKDGCVVTFSVVVPGKDMLRYEEEAINEYQKTARINGFRPGKVPRNILLRFYKNNIKKEILSRSIPNICTEAMTQMNVNSLTQPAIEKIDYDLNQDLSVSAKIEVYPEFDLENYQKLEIKKIPETVTDKEVDAQISDMAEYSAQFETITDRALEEEDFAVIDYEIRDGEEVKEKKEGIWMKVTPDSAVKEFTEGMKGMKPGDEREMEITLPENYSEKDLAGKKVTAKALLKEIRKKNIPEINDEYVKKLNPPYESLDQYKEKVKEFLQSQKKQRSEMMIKEQVASHLLSLHKFDLPPTLVNMQKNDNAIKQVRELKSRGFNDQMIRERQEEIVKAAQEQAVSQLKLEFIYQKIIETEKVAVSEEELNQTLEKESSYYGMTKEKFVSHLRKNKQFETFKHQAEIEKAISLILDQAVITEEKENEKANKK